MILLRERLLLFAPLRHGHNTRRGARSSTEDRARLVRGRVAALERGEWLELLEHARAAGRGLAVSRRVTPREHTDQILADSVIRKAMAEEFSRAAQLLGSPGLAPLTDDTAERMQHLLQPRPRASPASEERAPAVDQEDLLDEGTFKKVLKSSPVGSGAAVGGCRFEHWKVVLGSPSAFAALLGVCQRLARGHVPECAAKALALSKLTPLLKPGGGIRPIAAPSILRRLVGKALVRERKEDLASALGKQQFAIGTTAGTEVLAHSARALAEDDPDIVFLALDAENAYCSVARATCLAELAALSPALVPCAELFSKRLSHYYFWDSKGKCHQLTASDGVDQGDPLAPLLFACGIRPRLTELERMLRERAGNMGLPPDKVRIFAYLDDVLVAVPAALAEHVLHDASSCFGGLGLKLRPDKTQAWSPRAACPVSLRDQWRPNGITVVGVPLGEPLPHGELPAEGDDRRVDLGSTSFEAERAKEVADRARALLAKIATLPEQASPHLPAVQSAGLLLRLCGVGKVTHLLRTIPPDSTANAALIFDEGVLASYETLAGLDPLTRQQRIQCQLPLRCGGRGLRSQAATAPAAWCASWAQCAADVRMRTGIQSLVDLGSCPLPLAAACRAAAASLPAISEAAPTLCWVELCARPVPKLQRVICKVLNKQLHEDLLGELDVEGAARLRSCVGSFAGAWQLASPATPATRLVDHEYTFSARSLLGQAVCLDGRVCSNVASSGARAGAPCGEILCAHGHHAHRCNRGGLANARSRDLEDVWEAIHRECGCTTSRQVHVPAWDRSRWVCTTCPSQNYSHQRGHCPTCRRERQQQREEAILDVEAQSG